ncbi:MAG TPA: aminodeoxychorismate synthase component I [Pseudonocardiaceae bacterium]|nr:aminodeoxychorismate synthase component I [Pseudonocardiaceae bacterium]
MTVRPLDGNAEPELVLRRLVARARARGLPPPAALVGDWFGGGAVLAPSVRLVPAGGPPPPLPAVEGPVGAVGGGWIGYLGYGLADPVRRRRRLPAAALGWVDHVLRRDRTDRWWYEELGRTCSGKGDSVRYHELAALVAADGLAWCGGTGPRPTAEPGLTGLGPTGLGLTNRRTPDAVRYRSTVRRAVAEIAAGEIYQVNVCTRYQAMVRGEPAELFAAGVARWRPARAAFLTGAWGSLASFSPELFLARRGSAVTTSPIKGTRPRREPADDVGARLLRASVKDVAENVMIVDMARNDLGRVCTTGSVTVPRLLEVQPHPGVWHLVSTVAGQLAPGTDDAALLGATFPPASVTGTPKHRALQVIGELEDAPREVYCGAIGLASPVAGTEYSVAIRTCEFSGEKMWLGVGGGITADSDPDAEWAECETKAAPVLDLLGW